MPSGSLLLLAGPNGAGKSTLIQSVREELGIPDYTSLNADERTLQKVILAGFVGFDDPRMGLDVLKQLFIESANEVHQETLELLRSGRNVCLETVLSTDKYCALVEEVLRDSGAFEMFFVALNSPELSGKRVKIRVRKFGHDVPAERLRERWQRSLAFLPGLPAGPPMPSSSTTRGRGRLLLRRAVAELGSGNWNPAPFFLSFGLRWSQNFPN